MCNYSEIFKKFYYQIRITHQIFIGVFFIMSAALFLVTFVITFNVFLISNTTYKDFINIFDNAEYQQLTLFSVTVEQAHIQHIDCYKDNTNIFKHFYNNLIAHPELQINTKYINEIYNNPVVHFSDYKNNEDKIVFFSPTKDKAALLSTPEVLLNINIFANLYMLVRKYKIFNCFIYEHDLNYFETIVFIDYSLDLIFVYPPNALDIQDLLNNNIQLRSYIKDREIDLLDKTFKLRNNIGIPINEDNLPFYEEDVIFSSFAKQGFKALTLTSNKNVISNTVTTLQSFLILSRTTIADSVYDPTALKVQGARMIVTDYQSNYKIYSQFQCGFLHFEFDYDYIELSQLDNLGDCLAQVQNSVHQNDLNKSAFYFNLDLFNSDNIDSNNTNSIIQNFTNVLLYNKNPLFFLLYKMRFTLNTTQYKMKKIILPITNKYLTNHYYPIQNIYYAYLFKSEGYFKNNKSLIFVRTVSNFFNSLTLSLLTSYLIMGFVAYQLYKVNSLINTPLKLIHDTVQSISDKTKFKESKAKLEDYTIKNTNCYIDEFVDLIVIILDLVEGNINLSEPLTDTNYYKVILEAENNYREFEIIKINNIIVLEGVILQKDEKKTALKKILDQNIDELIKNDEVVTKNFTFQGILYKPRSSSKRSNLFGTSISDINNEEKFIIKSPNIPFCDSEVKKKTERRKRNKSVINRSFSSSASEDSEEEEEEGGNNANNNTNLNDMFTNKPPKKLIISDEIILNMLNHKHNPLYNKFKELNL
jgi:hypothetical protein